MTASPPLSRYQREQRFTVASWAVAMLLCTLCATACHLWSTVRSASSDDSAAPAVTMHTWLSQSQPSINGLVDARNKIAAAASRHDIHGTGVACQAADGAMTNLRDHMPSPEPTVNQLLQQAISSYTLGLPDCVAASRTQGGEGMQRAASLIRTADSSMQLALDILADDPDAQSDRLGMLIV